MRGLTRTDVLRYIHRMLGAAVQEIELTDDEIMRVVEQESRVTYSKFFPYRWMETITPKDSINEKMYPNVYKIPNTENLEIFGIQKVLMDHTNQFGGTLLPLQNDPIQSQLLNDILSETITPVTFDFQAPDLVTIRPKIYKNMGCLVQYNSIHPKHLKTIPVPMRDQFLRLCLDDVLISLYPIRHRFESLSTPYGTLQPFFELVDGAAADKEALLASWQDNFLKDSHAKKIWIA